VDEQNGRACEAHQTACKGDCITLVMLHCTLGGGRNVQPKLSG
jgi:hypothetical protein